MILKDKGELSILSSIRKRFPAHGKDVLTAIGDDCAVVKAKAGLMLFTSDCMAEGVHFDFRYTTAQQLGFKIVSANASDIYAMAGTPRHMLLSIAAEGKTDIRTLDGIFSGVKDACGRYGIELVGGDMSGSMKGLFLSVAMAGDAKKPVLRSGARIGDGIFVTDTLGDSACGLELLRKIKKTVDFQKPIEGPLKWTVMKPLLRKHLLPVAKDPGRLANEASAMIDVSDGLLIDLYRLLSESGKGARIYKEAIPMSMELESACKWLKTDPMEFALSGGEDYELLFTSKKRAVSGAVRIGEICREGLTLLDQHGRETQIQPRGFTHFR